MELSIVEILTRPGTYVLAGCIFILTGLIKRVVQLIWPSLKQQAHENEAKVAYATTMATWWNKVILYAIPVAFGGGSSFLPSDFFFGQLPTDARVMTGCLVGFFSGYLVKVAKQLLAKKTGVAFNSEPPAGPSSL
jgi:hypothetical protein